MRIAIAGATGAVGRHVVDIVRERGHVAVALSRSAGVDLLDPTAVTGALVGADSVIDVASIATTSGRASEQFFRATTTNLLAAGAEAGVGHHVALSIVGIDRAPSGYYAGKVVQERLVETGPLPWSILRATQFHEFAAQMLERARLGPVRAIPMMRMQPVAAREVAARLVELAEADARGRATDLAGPREENLVDLARAYAAVAAIRGPIVAVPLPGGMGAAMRNGVLLPGPEAQLGSLTFAEWLRALESFVPGPASTR
jgi:uncharacterized protein YbjT (DUF2867 family)